SRRYKEWQNLALEATTDAQSEEVEVENPPIPAVKRPEYETPRTILQRPRTTLIQRREVEASQEQDIPDCSLSDEAPAPSDKSPSDKRSLDLASVASEESDLSFIADEDPMSHVVMIKEELEDQDYDECVYYHEGSDLYAEDVDGQMAVLPEVPVTTEGVKIDDIQLCGSDSQTPEEIGRLRQKIWKFRHLLIGRGNALPPAARGVVCDIDVGGARPFALKCRKLWIQFREKLADLIKGLLSAKMINYSRSPWASPIVVIIKKNGVDIRLCIDYRLVNSLTQLIAYPMPLINDLLEDL
ncbi:reverse transcriptase, partial [Phytophthora megakarya]